MNRTSRSSRLVSSAARSPALAITGPEVERKPTPSSRAMIWASVVLPSPGGPANSTWSSASARALAASMNTLRLERACSWPMNSRSSCGRSDCSASSASRLAPVTSRPASVMVCSCGLVRADRQCRGAKERTGLCRHVFGAGLPPARGRRLLLRCVPATGVILAEASTIAPFPSTPIDTRSSPTSAAGLGGVAYIWLRGPCGTGIRRQGVHASTYSAMLVGGGTSRPSALRPSIWKRMASRISASMASTCQQSPRSRAGPARRPNNFRPPFRSPRRSASLPTFQTRLLQDAVERSWRKIILLRAGAHASPLLRAIEEHFAARGYAGRTDGCARPAARPE